MNDQEVKNQIIARIIASQEKQLEVDAIKEATKNNMNNIEEIKTKMLEKNMSEYLINMEKIREEKRKYTQTFREELIKEQREKERIKNLTKKTLQAYEQQTYIVPKFNLPKFLPEKEKLEHKKHKGILQIIREILKIKPKENKKIETKKLEKREEFVSRISYRNEKIEPKKEQKQEIKKQIDSKEYR